MITAQLRYVIRRYHRFYLLNVSDNTKSLTDKIISTKLAVICESNNDKVSSHITTKKRLSDFSNDFHVCSCVKQI